MRCWCSVSSARARWTVTRAVVRDVKRPLIDHSSVPPDDLRPAKDPRTPALLQVAHSVGMTNDQVNALVALDAQLSLAGIESEKAREVAYHFVMAHEYDDGEHRREEKWTH